MDLNSPVSCFLLLLWTHHIGQFLTCCDVCYCLVVLDPDQILYISSTFWGHMWMCTLFNSGKGLAWKRKTGHQKSKWFHWGTEQKLVPVCCNWQSRNPSSSLAALYFILLIEASDSFFCGIHHLVLILRKFVCFISIVGSECKRRCWNSCMALLLTLKSFWKEEFFYWTEVWASHKCVSHVLTACVRSNTA